MPRIRSESPAFDLNHPEAEIPTGGGPLNDAPIAEVSGHALGKVV